MESMMKKFFMIILVSIFSLTMFADGSTTYKEGDVIFIISKSSQSKFVQYATKSLWSHCGFQPLEFRR